MTVSSYQALYRKFRPATFDDVKGQEHIVTTLQNQIEKDRLSHAYLFCGTRGTGKTTIARILAKAVNCENPSGGNPCCECDSCRKIAASVSLNVFEIDAASNNGVDNIRDIVEQVSYSPAEGKYKVYIIDEAHNVSSAAFNALLKTLEEPPSYVIFVLATTEPNKIPITILSRCQRYDFKRISIDTITERLSELTQKEGIDAEPRALRYIARCGDGSMRDSLSLMDQVIAFLLGEKLTYERTLLVLGTVDQEVLSRLTRHLIAKDVNGCITLLEEVVMQGRELVQFVTDYIWYLRNLLLAKTSEDPSEIIDVAGENYKLLMEEKEMLETDTIMRYIRIFSDLSGKIRYAAGKRVLVEMALIRICRPSMEQDLTSLTERIRDLERKFKEGLAVTAQIPQTERETQSVQPKKAKPQLPQAVPEDIKRLVSNWQGIIAGFEQPMKHYLQRAGLSLSEEGRLLIVLEDGVAYDYFTEDEAHRENQARLERLLSEEAGKEIRLTIQPISRNESFDENYADLTKIVQMDIEIEE